MAYPYYDYNDLPKTFQIENVRNWFFYNLAGTRLPQWYLEEYENEIRLMRIAQILNRQGLFNEITRQAINQLWADVHSLSEYVLALEIRLDLKDGELQDQIHDLELKDAEQDGRMDAIDTRIDGIEDRVEHLEEDEADWHVLKDFLDQGQPGEVVTKDPLADNQYHINWLPVETGLDLEVDYTSTNDEPSVTLDKNDEPAELGVDFGIAGLIPPVDSEQANTKVLASRVEDDEVILSWDDKDSVEVELDVDYVSTNALPSLTLDDGAVPAKLEADFGVAGLLPVVPVSDNKKFALEVTTTSGNITSQWIEASSSSGGGEIIKPIEGLGYTRNNTLFPFDSTASAARTFSTHATVASLPATGDVNTVYSKGSAAYVWMPNAKDDASWRWTGNQSDTIPSGGQFVRISQSPVTTAATGTSGIVDRVAPVWNGETISVEGGQVRSVLTFTYNTFWTTSAWTAGMEYISPEISLNQENWIPFIQGSTNVVPIDATIVDCHLQAQTTSTPLQSYVTMKNAPFTWSTNEGTGKVSCRAVLPSAAVPAPGESNFRFSATVQVKFYISDGR